MSIISYKDYLNEKFSEQSDPIADMGIGGMLPKEALHEIMDKAYKAWAEWLKQFEGKKVTGKFYLKNYNNTEKMYTFHVKAIKLHFEKDKTIHDKNQYICSTNFAFISEEDNEYYSHGMEKFYVKE